MLCDIDGQINSSSLQIAFLNSSAYLGARGDVMSSIVKPCRVIGGGRW